MKQLKNFTDVELKAINWDILVEIEKLQAQKQAINNELASRAKNTQATPKMENEQEVVVESEVTGTEPVETGEVTANEVAE